jgi:hypothetical protein
LALVRRDLGAEYVVDLHDDSQLVNYYVSRLSELSEYERYWLVDHMGYSASRQLLSPFAKSWNERRRRS